MQLLGYLLCGREIWHSTANFCAGKKVQQKSKNIKYLATLVVQYRQKSNKHFGFSDFLIF
jgi:hypothetical protein